MKRYVSIIFFMAVIAGNLWAGDIATFKNLGFSSDSKYFMFAQYGVNEKTSTPYAELYNVYINSNDFTNNGIQKFSGTQVIEPGDSGDGALFKLLEDNIELTRKYKIDHLIKGRILYLLVNGQTPEDTIEFRDFYTGKKYRIFLNQSVEGTGKDVKSSFFIDLYISLPSGSTISKKIGHSTYKRSGVKGYKIRQILIAPNDKSLIFVIERGEADDSGVNVRYMVEAVFLE